MEKIKIRKKKKLYGIESITQNVSEVLKIVFPEDGEIPDEWSGAIQICTAGGIPYAEKTGYETVYLRVGQTIYLSNDGSVYVPPAPPEPVPEPEPYVPTLEEIKASKKAEISAICEQIIYAGINLTLTDGESYHFSLTEKDQINLFGKLAQLKAGVERVEYHADGHPCQYYSAEDMTNIVESSMWHVSYHTTYCNALNMWIAGCHTVEEVQEIYYGADVPEEYRSEVLNAYLIQIAEMAPKGGEDEESDNKVYDTAAYRRRTLCAGGTDLARQEPLDNVFAGGIMFYQHRSDQ